MHRPANRVFWLLPVSQPTDKAGTSGCIQKDICVEKCLLLKSKKAKATYCCNQHDVRDHYYRLSPATIALSTQFDNRSAKAYDKPWICELDIISIVTSRKSNSGLCDSPCNQNTKTTGMNAPCSTGMEWAAHLGLPPIRALPPIFGSPCAAPPCPRFVRRDSSAVPTSIFKPPAKQRFNLIVPTSLIERNFDMNYVLQCGLTVVFKRLNRDPSQPAEALQAVHGCVSRHLSPIGLTSYRVTGQQPDGVGSGCSLHGWSVEGGCLVVEVASRHHPQRQQLMSDAQESALGPARSLFGDCLPSPATIQKQQPQREEFPESPEHTYPLRNQHGCHNLLPQQLQEASETSTTDVTTLPLFRKIHSDESCLKVTEDATIIVPSSCEGESSSSLPAWDDGSETYKPSQVLSKPAQQSCKSRRHDRMVVTTPDQRPKRHRQCPTWYSKDEDLSTAFAGIDLLLAAHMALVQQEASRPKRLRRPNSLFMQ